MQATLYNPNLVRPDTKGSHKTKREAFYAWLDANYPDPTIRISREDFERFGRRGAYFMSMFTKTNPEMKKSWEGGEVEKHRWSNVVANARYSNMVNNARQRLFEEQHAEQNNELVFIGDGVLPPVVNGEVEHFVARRRHWGVRRQGTPFVDHKGKVYLEVAIRSILRDRYFVDGVEVDSDTVVPHLRKKDTLAIAMNQGLPEDRQVMLRDYNFSNITTVRFCKRMWIVED
jgi:hypothetical protein